MPRGSTRFWGVVSLFLLVNLAGLAWIRHDLTSGVLPRVRVLAALPQREVDRTDRFTLVFDDALVGPGEVGKPVASAPFRVEPAVGGRWNWAAPARLEFLL